MEQPPRKRGRPKLFLTKEMVEERRQLKRICKNSRRSLQGTSCAVAASNRDMPTSSVQGESPPGENTYASLDEIGGNGPSDENLESYDGVGGDSPGLHCLLHCLQKILQKILDQNCI